MLDQLDRDRIVVLFSGGQACTEPLTWGQKAIWQDMQASGSQFTMPGMMVCSGRLRGAMQFGWPSCRRKPKPCKK